MHRFFKSPVWRGLDFLATMFILNMMWLLGSLPVITAGASTAALCHAYLRILQKREEPLLRLFKEGFQSNFRQATAVWIVYLVFFLDAAIVLWSRENRETMPAWASGKPFLAAAVLVGVVVVFTAVYIFAVIAHYDCTTRQCFINALGLSFRYPLRTVLLAGLTGLTGFAVYCAPFLGMLAPSVCCYIQCRLLLRIFRAQEEGGEPQEEKRPS